MDKFCLLVRITHRIVSFGHLNLKEEAVLCLLYPLFKLICAQIFNKFIRVLIGLHMDNLSGNACSSQHRNCPHCSLYTCTITVVGQKHLIRITPDQIGLLLGKCRSKRGNCIGKTGLMQSDHIHISLTQDHIVSLTPLGIIESKQVPAFVKDLCLR